LGDFFIHNFHRFRRNLQTALRVLPVTVLTGARQTGKTTLTRAIEPARAYFTLDDMGGLDQAERNPDSLLSTRPVILDEVQRAPPILLAVKRAVDIQRRAGDFTLTGSANLLLMKHAPDTLAGRAIYLDLRSSVPRSGRSVKTHYCRWNVCSPRILTGVNGRMSPATGRHGC
jgi:predicted AAA+ superfamily ATPase